MFPQKTIAEMIQAIHWYWSQLIYTVLRLLTSSFNTFNKTSIRSIKYPSMVVVLHEVEYVFQSHAYFSHLN